MTIRKDRVTIEPVDGTVLSDFLDTDWFSGFTPGMTFEEAEQQHGRPNNYIIGSDVLVNEYWMPAARVAIAHRPRNTPSRRIPPWVLSVFPTNVDYRSVLRFSISKHIDYPANLDSHIDSRLLIEILNTKGDPWVLVYVVGTPGRVESIDCIPK